MRGRNLHSRPDLSHNHFTSTRAMTRGCYSSKKEVERVGDRRQDGIRHNGRVKSGRRIIDFSVMWFQNTKYHIKYTTIYA